MLVFKQLLTFFKVCCLKSVWCAEVFGCANSWIREALLKGKDQYGWPPCTYWFRSAAFQTEILFLLFYKTTYLNEEHTDPSPSVRLPWLNTLGVKWCPTWVKPNGLSAMNNTTARSEKCKQLLEYQIYLDQGILKGEVSLYCWPPARLAWYQLYDNWQFLFLFSKQANSNQWNSRSTVQWYFPL